MDKVISLLSERKFVFNCSLVKVLDKDISLNDFLVLVYLDNCKSGGLVVNDIVDCFSISLEDVMASIDHLCSKNLVKMDTSLDSDGRMNEIVLLDGVYSKIDSLFSDSVKESKSSDVFNAIENEFGRSLSPTELEIINGWCSTGTSDELILGALKEASYNGVRNLRYIDKVLYEWGKKGFKSMNDVNSFMQSKDDTTSDQELFDYNWLDDEE